MLLGNERFVDVAKDLEEVVIPIQPPVSVEEQIVPKDDLIDLLKEENVSEGDFTDSFEGKIILVDCKASSSRSSDVWIMDFDGSSASMGSGARVVLVSPEGEFFPYSYKLQFPNTNNIAEYEALILGLNMAQIKGIQNLHVKGDVELVVCQVKGQYQARNDQLRHYRDLSGISSRHLMLSISQ